jgi:replicative DNA helicase
VTLTPSQEHDLEIARQMAAAGVPMFVAYPDPEGKTQSGRATGYSLPTGWQTTSPNPAYVDAWRPGMALCAVMGHGLDLADADPRHGGSLSDLDGMTPRVRGVAATPSGGDHLFVSSMGVRSRDDLMPGIDVKAGLPGEKEGCGFAFIAPTVRKSKVTGDMVAYRWTEPPDLEGLGADSEAASQSKLAALVRQKNSKTRTRTLFQQPGGHSDGWTDPDIARLISAGIPAGHAQQPILRDTIARLVGQGYDRVVCRGIWQAIVDRTTLTDPAWPWADADFDDMYESAARKYATTQRGGSEDQASQSKAWERPAPLGVQAALPPFPSGAFPDWLRAEVDAVAEFTQTPCDLAATVALGVLSAAVGGRAIVEVRGAWREPLNLFAVAAMPSGSRKSAVFAALTEPLLDTEQALVERVKPQIIEAETQRKVAQRDADKAAVQASGLDNGEARDMALANAIAAAQLAEAITVPVMPRIVADDITPEAAASLLAEQGGRLAVLSAEGGIFSILAGRYSGGVPSLEVFLKGHSGDLLRVDRRGRPPEHVPHPALTLGLCVQPDVLQAIAAMPGFRGRGLLARILYSLPANLVGHRKIGTAPVPDDVRDSYTANMRTLVLTFAEWLDPAVLTLTPAAAALLLAAERALEPRLDPDTGDLAAIVDWASKQIGATVRIAGLLHLAAHVDDGWGRPVTEDTMQAAIRITEYFTAHALAAFDHMGVDPVLADARVLYRWLETARPEKFTKRELFTAVSRARFAKVGALDAPLDLLEQHGWIRREPEPERTGPGRKPSPAYLVHPDLAAETAVSAQRPGRHRSADTADIAAEVSR